MSIYRGQNRSVYSPNYLLLLAIALVSLFAFGCEDNKLAQCQQIFQVARNINEGELTASNTNRDAPLEIAGWLQAASKLDNAANSVAALKISQSQLVNYQNQLATIYRIYSQATYDAVRARENQNFAALESARDDVIKAGAMQQELVQKINNFCSSD